LIPLPNWPIGRAHSTPETGATLVGLLLESLDETPDPAVEAAWRAEIRRRIAAYERV
jgi:hypothetical protein